MDFHRKTIISILDDFLEPKYCNILVRKQKCNPIFLGHWRNVAQNSKRERESIIWKLICVLSNIFGMFEPATIKRKSQSDYSFQSSASSHTCSSGGRRSPDPTLQLVPQMGATLTTCIFQCPRPQNSSKRQQQCTSRGEYFQGNKTHNISSTKENK